jgi:hypothetical protein
MPALNCADMTKAKWIEALHRDPRQVDRIAHGLLDQIEGVDQHAEVGQAAGCGASACTSDVQWRILRRVSK